MEVRVEKERVPCMTRIGDFYRTYYDELFVNYPAYLDTDLPPATMAVYIKVDGVDKAIAVFDYRGGVHTKIKRLEGNARKLVEEELRRLVAIYKERHKRWTTSP